MEVGIDLVKISRFDDHLKFAKKILSDSEYSLYLSAINKPEYVASRFCLKEAFIKCLKIGILDIDLKKIIIAKEESGAIHIDYDGKIFKASLSHEKDYCIGVVIYD